MGYLEMTLLALAVAMDACAAATCQGLSMKKLKLGQAGVIGISFGAFQAVMPLIGYVLAASFRQSIQAVDHWIAFVLLAILGINMLKEANESCPVGADTLSLRKLLTLSVATSIDALAVGITFAFLHVELLPAISLIGWITAGLSFLSVILGFKFGGRLQGKAGYIGGVILILMGLRILLKHMELGIL